MGALWDVIQAELDRERFAVTDRALARRLGVSPGTIGNWRKGVSRLPDEKNLRAIADFVGRSYEDVLLTALSETGHAQGTRLADQHRPAAPRKIAIASDADAAALIERSDREPVRTRTRTDRLADRSPRSADDGGE